MFTKRPATLVEQSTMQEQPPQFEIGDTVDVHTKILEGNKERIQVFNGTVIARSGGGSREMFTVRRIVAGEGVERKFPVHSPRIAKVEVKRSSVIRRAKLYYLRDRVGKVHRLTADVGCRNTLYNATAQSGAEAAPVASDVQLRILWNGVQPSTYFTLALSDAVTTPILISDITIFQSP